ncbi:MAG: hypothetical protein Q7Q73_02270 [Verrucomicrobiota bacterium JB024]|nr:hypothetical protein [Verrucomicrobiota bacterium JB024]
MDFENLLIEIDAVAQHVTVHVDKSETLMRGLNTPLLLAALCVPLEWEVHIRPSLDR